jgi:hypothetical protein
VIAAHYWQALRLGIPIPKHQLILDFWQSFELSLQLDS